MGVVTNHQDPHDLGLLHDLAVLQARRPALPATPAAPAALGRRRALALLGGAGAGLVLVACGSDSSPAASSSTPTTSTTSSTAGATTTAGGAAVTGSIPEETAGPFPGDGSNGPNVLTESGVVRSDIRSSFGDHSGTATGVPTGVDLRIVRASDGAPLAGAAVYLWHCTSDGGYSLYSQGLEAENYLRGVQEADDAGDLSFTTVFPGTYDGRWPHMHFEVFSSLDGATTAGSRLVTSQLAVPEEICRLVYGSEDGYGQSAGNLDRTPLESDMVFQDGVGLQLADVSGDPGSDLRLSLTVAV